MPVPIPGPEVGSDSLKVEFLPIFGRPKTGFFLVNFRGPGVHSPNSRLLPTTQPLGDGQPLDVSSPGQPCQTPARALPGAFQTPTRSTRLLPDHYQTRTRFYCSLADSHQIPTRTLPYQYQTLTTPYQTATIPLPAPYQTPTRPLPDPY